ncbi:DUF938 domain-containing protein [Halieaceae bacterium IMCC14734]|uniref:DUF938 domain-containing protein n=1 Tax=Candidatus Litorirhabdus singularis TaxID=2518993 RepID=A0ABT3TCH8_9GAMM|nr:DUF938 domain-containing protein [Candidatus Litorirhabdus singularis]MCX2980003.1 DUF938 domain-containing protein [Candidatus Litorirhabdus singularis]
MLHPSQRPFSQACENNKRPILQLLSAWLRTDDTVLEIGSGTGQHLRFFAEQLPQVNWQPSDMTANLTAVRSWCDDYEGRNLLPVEELDVRDNPWPVAIPSAVYSANTLHIMGWSSVVDLFKALGRGAPPDSLLFIYGPFNYAGSYTSESNARFDQWLLERDANSAIRDFEAVGELATAAGYSLLDDVAMPANNRFLVWRQQPAAAA